MFKSMTISGASLQVKKLILPQSGGIVYSLNWIFGTINKGQVAKKSKNYSIGKQDPEARNKTHVHSLRSRNR